MSKQNKGSEYISRISKLNQFVKYFTIDDISKELKSNLENPEKGSLKPADSNVYINITNGCKVSEHTLSKKKRFPSKEIKLKGLLLTWTVNYNSVSTAHQTFLFGDELEKYLIAMEEESKRYR